MTAQVRTRLEDRTAARVAARKAARRAAYSTHGARVATPAPAYRLGDRVSARWTDGVWYPAVIAHVNGAGVLTVRYVEDGIQQAISNPAVELRRG